MKQEISYCDDDPERVVGEESGAEEQQQEADCPVSELHGSSLVLLESTQSINRLITAASCRGMIVDGGGSPTTSEGDVPNKP